MRTRPLSLPVLVASALLLLLLLALPARAQIGGYGWTPYTVSFKVQWPYLTNEASRYFSTNEPNPTYHCLVYSNDSPFEAGTTTLPRTEQRFEPDYTSGEIQYQAQELIPGNENSYCCFQIHTGDAESTALGSTVFMLFVFTNNNGSVNEYSGTQLYTNLASKWFQLNVDHNLNTGIIKVWINSNFVWQTSDNGAGDFYFKDGVYEQSHNPSFQMDTYITNILMWVNSGTNPPVAPTNLTASASGGQITLTWYSSSDATSYNIKRATSSSGPYAVVGNTSNTNYTDGSMPGIGPYYYEVSALDQFGESSNSAPASASLSNVWNGGSTSGNNWNDANNWNGTALVAGNSPIFAGTTRIINTNNFAAGTVFTNLVFLTNGGPFTLFGNPIMLAGGVVNDSAVVQTDNIPAVVTGNDVLNGGPGGLWIGAGITNTSSTLYTLHLQGNGTLAGPLQSTVAPLNLGITVDAIAGQSNAWSLIGNNNSLLTNLTVAAGNGFTLGTGSDAPSLIITNNQTAALTVDNATNTTSSFTLNSGRLALTNGNNTPLDLGTAGGTGIFNMIGGSAAFAGKYLMIGDSSSYGIFNMTGGTVTTAIANDIILGNSVSNSAGTVNLSGGTFNATANNDFYVSFRGTGTWNISGTGLLELQTLNMTRNSSDSGGATGTLNLNGGTVIMNGESLGTSGANQSGAINFNGGVLQAAQNNTSFITVPVANTFTTTVQSGGAIITNAGYSITIASPLVSGTSPDGGLVSEGAGMLIISGTNTYNGPTTVVTGTLSLASTGSISNSTPITVDAGATFVGDSFAGGPAFTLNSGQTLAGNGTASANIVVGSGATLAPGNPTGPLTFNTTLTLNGGSTTFMQLNKATHTNSVAVVIGTLTYGGTLALTNLNGTLAAGDSFKLFNAATYHGTFSNITPPMPAPDLLWNTNALATSGVLSIVSAPQPQFSNITMSGNSFVLTGTNGQPNQLYYVLTSTNLLQPTANWTVIATNNFDGAGDFNFTNTPDPNAPQTFYLIRF